MHRFIKYSPTLFLCCALTTFSTLADTVAVYDLDSPISENGITSTNPFLFNTPARPLTHFDIVRSLQAAVTDEDVKAVVVDPDGANLSLAQAQEIRSLLLEIRKQDKDVWVYTEYLTPITALLGSAASHMTLMPTGDIRLQGLYGESLYFKKMLDKVGVQVEVIHIGDYKSAGEELYRDSPSDFARKQQDQLLDSIYSQLLKDIAEGRGLSHKEINDIMDLGTMTPEDAVERKLVDHLKYRTDFVNDLKELYREETEFNSEYELPNLYGPEIKGFFDVMKILLNSDDGKSAKQPYIAVVPLEGVITDESVIDARREILKATRNENCKALVLRVNSPGGSALASDVLWEATQEWSATERPFVVSMGAVAASGGYYVSAGADQIFAERGTITGSIGVVGMKLVVGDALEKIGISIHTNQRGKYADLMNSNRSYSEEEAALVRKSMQHVYSNFKQRVSDGRQDRIKGDLEKLAGGRVYAGQEALNVGLVDQLGGLNDAIAQALKLSESEGIDIKMFPEPKNPFEGLFAAPETDEHEFIQAKKPTNNFALNLKTSLLDSPMLQVLDHTKVRQFSYFFQQMESIQTQHIQLIAPLFEVK